MSERPRRTDMADDATAIVQRIEELAQRCEALEATNGFLAAQIAEVNGAWRDAISAIADADPERVNSIAALRHMAAQSTGLRQRIFSEMADILEEQPQPTPTVPPLT